MSARLVREALAVRLDRKALRVTMSYREGGRRELWTAIDPGSGAGGERMAEAEVAGGAAVDVIVEALAQALSQALSQAPSQAPGHG